MQFGRLCQEHAGDMATLERECFALPWNEQQCKSALKQKAFAAFGIWFNRKLLAYVSFYYAAGDMDIINVAVKKGWRRKGLGGRILALVLQAAAKMGMQKASLEVRCSNLAAIALYEKLGFDCCGRRKRYYPDTGEDALIYIYDFVSREDL